MGFAHRGLHGTGLPENSLAAFEAALAVGAGIECDLRLTADGIPIIFHDRDTGRLCGKTRVCSEAHWADLAGLRLSGTDHRIPSLAELLALVAGRVPLLLELKDERNSARFSAAVAAELRKYEGPAGVMSFAAGVGRWLAERAPNVRRGLVLSGRDSTLRRWHKMRRSDPQFLAVKVTELGEAWLHSARERMAVYSWTVRSAAERKTATVHADACIWEADGRP
ncbi:glycerophosphodiester phosphodiesterase [Sphingomonas sp. HDW15A]|uniref:glycerophosphodiester phosphodiesterase family protein n=1 Tax=Sphingomonas sp. HDW15A TaxID=2714942 RepID=UPI00140B169D|nr:glycerophosphodiester phosphodiesterase family protein [Sphingomonas sp. HDW15A]QIK97036.1 glycerophosphodiester phosphodiesterase [Sphingomonas sp. HDW15A]